MSCRLHTPALFPVKRHVLNACVFADYRNGPGANIMPQGRYIALGGGELQAARCASVVSLSSAITSVVPDTMPRSFQCCSSVAISRLFSFLYRYSEFMRRYDKLADDIQRIEQELEADNDGQVVACVAACGAAVVIVNNAQRVVALNVLLFASRRCVLMRVM
jgi:hypothetical protein